ncbi:MAG: hypothetical protein HY360_06945 [Verrucomicrobia bacterium]|nr:hypothetical protein [Verrucomicrobiota bacterium]
MKITKHSTPRRATTESSIFEDEASRKGMGRKLKQFVEKGAEVYQKV